MTIDTSHLQYMIQNAAAEVANSWQRPSVLLRPRLYPDGNAWCALYGDNLQEGVAGFGPTPAHAMIAFDEAFYGRKP